MLELSVTVRVRDGALNDNRRRYVKIKEHGHNGLTYIEGREGQNFAIHFRNNSARRVLAVPSVDGLSVLDGQQATPDSRGYIVEPYRSIEIKGWRTSLDDISLFVFKNKDGSYSAQTGEGTSNCGVIAVKVFAEKEKPAPPPAPIIVHEHHHHDHYPTPVWPARPPWEPIWTGTPMYSCDSGDSSAVQGTDNALHFDNGILRSASPDAAKGKVIKAQSLSNAAPDFNLGAGWGTHEHDTVTEAPFERTHEIATLALYFTDAESLKKIGINLSKDVAVSAAAPIPQAFREGFCKAPKTA